MWNQEYCISWNIFITLYPRIENAIISHRISNRISIYIYIHIYIYIYICIYTYICINPAINPLILPKARTAQRLRDRTRPEASAVDAALPCSACTEVDNFIIQFLWTNMMGWDTLHRMCIIYQIWFYMILYVTYRLYRIHMDANSYNLRPMKSKD